MKVLNSIKFVKVFSRLKNRKLKIKVEIIGKFVNLDENFEQFTILEQQKVFLDLDMIV